MKTEKFSGPTGNKVLLIFGILFVGCVSVRAQYTQTVRGKIIDKVTSASIPGVNIILNNPSDNVGTASDANGEFVLKNVPVGRNNFMFTFIGYEPVFMQNIIVSSGKEAILNVEMVESVTNLDEVVVRAYKKGEVINKMATISARSFTIEETERYAGSWSDPARMATNFAGVLTSSNDTRNDIIIRGNSPTGLLWRLEGVDIPNPNHFAVQGTSGGPVSMLNSNLLTRSDFFTGAFPAQYGNALAGVFDLNMRNGNTQKHEFVLQAGLNGYEAGLEGPFSKKHKASYMINWRYSFLDVLQDLGFDIVGGAIPTYTDINFKFFFPTEKLGTFSIFGLGGIDDIKVGAENSTDQFNPIENTDLTNQTKMGVAGLTHKILFGEKSNLLTSFSYSGQKSNISLDSIMPDNTQELYYSSNTVEQQASMSMHFTKKINSKNTFSIGASLKHKWIDQIDSVDHLGGFYYLIDLDNEALDLLQGFAEWKHRFSSRTDIYAGLHSQYLLLNETNSFEPRVGFSWSFGRSQSLRLGYGIHSQTQTLPVYFVETANEDRTEYWRTCDDLEFSHSQHFIVGYTNKIADNWSLKIEGYLQDLWNIPVETKSSTFSVVNLGASYYNGTYDNDSLVNEGLGKNYGVELTLEKYLSSNWYFLMTTSLFDSRYKPSDGVWRHTVFASNYAANGLLGFEFPIGRRSSLDFNFRVVWSGGIRALYVDKEASLMAGEVVYDDSKAYSKRNKDYLKADSKVTFKHNMKGVSAELALDFINVTDRDNIFSETFDPATGKTLYTYQQGFLPTALFRVVF
ncbi:TonB-dependent receptor [Maribellus maritimus]|uniref:TonB-dependent receptor n=1 Tax=Maribellus maritimus TaxID=2870838 RepID=UPI001EEB3A5B|nr:TonB-dependent receptor [Maribellus maritimus]MCG6187420.1 TonB-dependent receptor [Maribellus maritimus]